jgi:hypothetical protein
MDVLGFLEDFQRVLQVLELIRVEVPRPTEPAPCPAVGGDAFASNESVPLQAAESAL